jgi:hypothetical protein
MKKSARRKVGRGGGGDERELQWEKQMNRASRSNSVRRHGQKKSMA